MNKEFEKILERLEEKTIPVLDEDEHIIPESNIREPYEIGMVALSDVNKIVQEVEEEYNNGWIPCSERLPDKAGYEVLATLENSFGQRRVTIIFTGYGDESFWHCNNKEYDLEAWKVIAWQPLPELYKEND